jgi:hypothetical protein
MSYHRKVCKDYRQISEDVFNNCVMPLVRLDKLKDCINKNLYKLLLTQRGHVLNDNWHMRDSFYNDLKGIYFFQNWDFFGNHHCYKCELKCVEDLIDECFKKNNTKVNNMFVSLGRYNIKYFSYFDKEFNYLAFFYHKYTKGRKKTYGYTAIDLATAENILEPKGVDMVFNIATIYESIKAIKKRLNNIYEVI